MYTIADAIKKTPSTRMCEWCHLISGFLSSQGVSTQVLSAFAGLTAVFGMGTGGSPQLSPLNYVIQASDKSDVSDSHSFARRL